jgi:hypothetical protein
MEIDLQLIARTQQNVFSKTSGEFSANPVIEDSVFCTPAGHCIMCNGVCSSAWAVNFFYPMQNGRNISGFHCVNETKICLLFLRLFYGAVCKVRGLTLLLRVGTLWRCGDGLFFEAPSLESDALLTKLHPLVENGVTVVLKEPFLGWWSNLSGASALRDSKVAMVALTEIGGTPLEHPQYSPDLAPGDFWALSTIKMELRGQNHLFHYLPEACGK